MTRLDDHQMNVLAELHAAHLAWFRLKLSAHEKHRILADAEIQSALEARDRVVRLALEARIPKRRIGFTISVQGGESASAVKRALARTSSTVQSEETA